MYIIHWPVLIIVNYFHKKYQIDSTLGLIMSLLLSWYWEKGYDKLKNWKFRSLVHINNQYSFWVIENVSYERIVENYLKHKVV